MQIMKQNIVFNYSSLNLTSDMISLLNRGLNFAVMEKNLDITQLFSDIKKFERKLIWKEFFHPEENEEVVKIPFIKEDKTNLPKKYTASSSLRSFLTATRSEILNPNNRNKVDPNLSPGELRAMEELIKLQKEQTIVIRKCDKGAGIIILNYDDYVNSCENHLTAYQNDNPHSPYYTKVSESFTKEAKVHIENVLGNALDNNIINKDEFDAMKVTEKVPGRFYCNFKVHKSHLKSELPPVRPIVSNSGSLTDNIGIYVDYFINDISTKHESYLQDTPDFLRAIEDLNSKFRLPDNTILVSVDISALYTNIPQSEGINSVNEALLETNISDSARQFVIDLLVIILKYNIFEFNGEHYVQNIGTAMGSRPAPAFANIFLARNIDKKIVEILNILQTTETFSYKLFKRFLDDLFYVICGTTKQVHSLFDQLNSLHPSIKFTIQHTAVISESDPCSCEKIYEISFLDTLLSLKDGKIIVDLYKKPTDRNQYLLPSSCHPNHVIENIPFSLALRIVRTCSESETRDKQLHELTHYLLDRNYEVEAINSAIRKAKTISRESALKKVKKKKASDRPTFVVKYDPRISDIKGIINKHWRSSKLLDPQFGQIFPLQPIIAYKRQRNLNDLLIRAKIQNKRKYMPRQINGMKKCTKNCAMCPFVWETNQIKSENFDWNLRKSYNCQTQNTVYMIECNKDNCKMRYVGESKTKLYFRFLNHKTYVNTKKFDQPTGKHFNLPGHSISNMKITIIEQVKQKDDTYRKERETYFIKKFQTHINGLNKKL